MRRFRSLLIDRADLRIPGLHVLRVAVHRHLPEHASVELHAHAWSQAIVYLSGTGVQTIGQLRRQIETASLVVLPPGQPHAFERRRNRAPLCVLIDFRLRGDRRKPAVVCGLTRSELAQLRQSLSHLQHLQGRSREALRWEGAIPVLHALLTILRAAGWMDRSPGATRRPNSGIRALLAKVTDSTSLAAAIQQSGYQRDHLNRLIKAETGLTLGQYRAQRRLATAKALLQRGVRVGAVAAAVGLPDHGYFSRWFRRQTGVVPSRFGRAAPPATA